MLQEDYIQKNDIVSLKVKEISKYCNPFIEKVWDFGKPVSKKRVSFCLKNNILIGFDDKTCRNQYNHSGRIAYLIKNKATDPIALDIFDGEVVVNDGNHRLAAAIYNNETYLAVSLGCSVKEASILFTNLEEN
jgi:hypothetical protein